MALAKGKFNAATVSARVIAPNADRAGIWFDNGTAVSVYLGFGEAAAPGEGVKIPAGAALSLTIPGLIKRSINACTVSGTATGISYQEF